MVVHRTFFFVCVWLSRDILEWDHFLWTMLWASLVEWSYFSLLWWSEIIHLMVWACLQSKILMMGLYIRQVFPFFNGISSWITFFKQIQFELILSRFVCVTIFILCYLGNLESSILILCPLQGNQICSASDFLKWPTCTMLLHRPGNPERWQQVVNYEDPNHM